MENVHILTHRLPARGDYVPFSTEQPARLETDLAHKLVTKLQTTLDVNELLNIYADHLARIIKVSGLQFHCSLGVFQMQGSNSQFGASSFELELNKEHLGQLVYFSQYPFSEGVKHKLERMHQCLIYPLRNALMYQRVLRLATKDTLTGLYNRSQFNDNLAEKLERCRRQHRNFSLMLLDLDNFKQVNDRFGHKSGDEVLVHFANILKGAVRATDAVFRFGGDEFAILIDDPNFTTNKVIAERIMNTVRNSEILAKHDVTTSIGFTLATSQDCDDAIFARADKGLYKAKNAGRDCARTA